MTKPNPVLLIVLAFALLLGSLVAFKLVNAELTRSSPPPACQLWGGTWDLWNGWRCA